MQVTMQHAEHLTLAEMREFLDEYCNKVSVNSFASTKSSIFQRLSILRVFLFWFAAEPGRREPAGRPQVPAQRRRHQAACLPVSAASGSSASQSAFSMLQ